MATRMPLLGEVERLTSRPAARPRRDALRRLRRNRLAVIGAIVVALLLVIAAVGPALAPWHYRIQDLDALRANGNRPLSPLSPAHLMGTDGLGRDLFSRLLDGAQISVSVALVVQLVVLVIGVPIGAAAGWFGGRLDNYLMRFTDVIYAFPDLLFIILLSVTFRETFLGEAMDGMLLIFVAIGLTAWVTMARLVRGQVLSLKESEFVEAARATGVSDLRIVVRHILPNSIGPVIVAVTLGIPSAILAEATLSFIGIGIEPPRASWGSLIAEGTRWVQSEPHLVVFPALALAITLTSFTFLGDGLRDALDPKLRGRQ